MKRLLAILFLTFVAHAQPGINTINLGAAANDRTGDVLRVGGAKINANFTNLWRTVFTNSPVNVKDFGAVGDGVADDTIAINSALNLAASTQRSVLFPAGVYLTAPITIPSGVVALIGHNAAGEKFASESQCVIRAKPNSSTHLIEWPTGVRTAAYHLFFDGNSTNQVGANNVAVIGKDSPTTNRDEVHIFGCTFYNGKGSGLVIQRPEVYLQHVNAILNKSHGIVYDGVTAGYGASDCTLDYVGAGFNGGDGILFLSPASANRLRNIDSYFNVENGINLSGTIGSIRMDMVQANNNFQHNLKIDGGPVSAINAVNSIFANANWHDNSFGTTNAAATGTYSDVYLGASLGVYSTAITFVSCNIGQAIGAPQVLNPKYAIEDARSGGPSTNGLGISLINCFSSPNYAFGSGVAIPTNIYQRGFVINHTYLDNSHGDTYLGKSDKTWLGSEINFRPLGSTMTNWNGVKQYLWQSGGMGWQLNEGGTPSYVTISSNANLTIGGAFETGQSAIIRGYVTNYERHRIESQTYTNGVLMYIYEPGGLGLELNSNSGSPKYALFGGDGNVTLPGALTNAAAIYATQVYTAVGTNGYFQADLNTTTNETPIAVRVNGTLLRVTVGAPDSGGAGWRLLRVAN